MSKASSYHGVHKLVGALTGRAARDLAARLRSDGTDDAVAVVVNNNNMGHDTIIEVVCDPPTLGIGEKLYRRADFATPAPDAVPVGPKKSDLVFALEQIAAVRVRYEATGFPVDLYTPDPATWMERRAQGVIDWFYARATPVQAAPGGLDGTSSDWKAAFVSGAKWSEPSQNPAELEQAAEDYVGRQIAAYVALASATAEPPKVQAVALDDSAYLRAEIAALEAEKAQAAGWGAAVGGRLERIRNLKQSLAAIPLSVGERVRKRRGDYLFPGTVQAALTKRSGQVRYVVENDEGILHVFSPADLERVE